MSPSGFLELNQTLPIFPGIPYQMLAAIYDQVMRHVDYRQWAKYIESLFCKNQFKSPTILDIGCGTGQLAQQLSLLGYRTDGCDLSPQMLDIARVKNPEGKFYRDQLPGLEQTEMSVYPVITCLYDTMNYLTTLEQFGEALSRIFTLLPSPGIFIFDIVSENFCLQYFDNVDEQEVVNKTYAYKRSSYYIKARSEQVNKFSIFTPEGIYEETHVQKIYPYHSIKKLIRESTPFHLEGVFEDFTFYPATTNSNRAHFVLRKP